MLPRPPANRPEAPETADEAADELVGVRGVDGIGDHFLEQIARVDVVVVVIRSVLVRGLQLIEAVIKAVIEPAVSLVERRRRRLLQHLFQIVRQGLIQ
jgi:hypothetical protein